MGWSEIERTTTKAPRELHRTGGGRWRSTPNTGPGHSKQVWIPAPPPSVGGIVTKEHVIWRCTSCRALAVSDGAPPGKCGKCKT